MNLLSFITSLEAAKIPPSQIIFALKEHLLLQKEGNRQRVKKHRENNKAVTFVQDQLKKDEKPLNNNETVTSMRVTAPQIVTKKINGELLLENNKTVTENALQDKNDYILTNLTLEDNKQDKKKSKTIGTRFSLLEAPSQWLKICRDKRPDLDPLETFEAFRDWWIAQTGQKALKADWDATWRTWLRNQKAVKPNGHGPPVQRTLEERLAEIDAIRQQETKHG